MIEAIKYIGIVLLIMAGALFLVGAFIFFIVSYRLRGGKAQKGTVCSFHVGNCRHSGTVISSNHFTTEIRSHIDREIHTVFTKDLTL